LDWLIADCLKRSLLKRRERLELQMTVRSVDRPVALPG